MRFDSTKKDVVLLSLLIGKPDWTQRLVEAMIQCGALKQLDEILPDFQSFFASNLGSSLIDTRAQLLSDIADTRRTARNTISEALDLYFCMNYDSLTADFESSTAAAVKPVIESPQVQRVQQSLFFAGPASSASNAQASSSSNESSPIRALLQKQQSQQQLQSAPQSMDFEEQQSEPATKLLKMMDIAKETELIKEVDQEAAQSGIQQMRVYQEELAASGVAGFNSVIVAPTGSGKTLVSIRIAGARLEEDPDARVCFLADRKHLVEQQYEAFKAQLPARFRDKISPVTGGEGERAPLSYQLRHHSVLIVSTQILLNSLKDKDEDGLNGDLTKFKLIIFDECHNCAKDHPSNKIMEYYFQVGCGRSPVVQRGALVCQWPRLDSECSRIHFGLLTPLRANPQSTVKCTCLAINKFRAVLHSYGMGLLGEVTEAPLMKGTHRGLTYLLTTDVGRRRRI
uniref:Helicase ATP-binding domain-containing protein n=1 Tax=Macrostomum lignano TaxID=282301 RepID=A0A1I8FV22_9PLAT